MEETVKNHEYHFSFARDGRVIDFQFVLSDDSRFPDVIRQFSDFMSAVYGYRIDSLDNAAEE